MIKPCSYCGEDYEAKTKRSRFCSDSCRFDAWAKDNRKSSVATQCNAKSTGEIDALATQLERQMLDLESRIIDAVMDSDKGPNQNDVTSYADLSGIQEMLTVLMARTENIEHKLDHQSTPRLQQSPARQQSDDELMALLEVKDREDDPDNNSTYNFLITVSNTAHGSDVTLPPEVYEYGIRTGRIKSNATGPRKMETPDIALVAEDDFDDMDITINVKELDE